MPSNLTPSSYSVFRDVDDLVSKPVLGSDGCASWQDFRKENDHKKLSVAPSLPMKRVDKLATGFNTLQQERDHEDKVRLEAGEAPQGSGYTAFKRKVNAGEIAEKKRIKMISERRRPDNKLYFVAAEKFEGWKEDYVFTTKDRGLGYYWDGMDSWEKLSSPTHGKDKIETKTLSTSINGQEAKSAQVEASTPTSVSSDQNIVSHVTPHPVDSVTCAIRQRAITAAVPPSMSKGRSNINEAIEIAALTGSVSLSKASELSINGALLSWESAVDPSSGRTYYFCRATGERSWEKPKEAKVTTLHFGSCTDKVPDGWEVALDPASKREYYFNRKLGLTQWEKPL